MEIELIFLNEYNFSLLFIETHIDILNTMMHLNL